MNPKHSENRNTIVENILKPVIPHAMRSVHEKNTIIMRILEVTS